VHALCNVQAIITDGLLRIGELADDPEESFSAEYLCPLTLGIDPFSDCLFTNRKRRVHRVFLALTQMVPGLEDRLVEGSDEDVVLVAEMVGHGTSFFLSRTHGLKDSKRRIQC
jgi:hypothetical protein